MRIVILEWLATLILIAGTAVNSLGYYPQGPLLLCVGGAVWFAIAIEWRKASLIVVNGVMLLTGIVGLIVHYWG